MVKALEEIRHFHQDQGDSVDDVGGETLEITEEADSEELEMEDNCTVLSASHVCRFLITRQLDCLDGPQAWWRCEPVKAEGAGKQVFA